MLVTVLFGMVEVIFLVLQFIFKKIESVLLFVFVYFKRVGGDVVLLIVMVVVEKVELLCTAAKLNIWSIF